MVAVVVDYSDNNAVKSIMLEKLMMIRLERRGMERNRPEHRDQILATLDMLSSGSLEILSTFVRTKLQEEESSGTTCSNGNELEEIAEELGRPQRSKQQKTNNTIIILFENFIEKQIGNPIAFMMQQMQQNPRMMQQHVDEDHVRAVERGNEEYLNPFGEFFQHIDDGGGNDDDSRSEEGAATTAVTTTTPKKKTTSIFNIACEIHGMDTVMKLLDDSVFPSTNMNEALYLMSMQYNLLQNSRNEKKKKIIHFGGLYFLLRKQQDMIQQYRTSFHDALIRTTTNKNSKEDRDHHPIEKTIATIFTVVEKTTPVDCGVTIKTTITTTVSRPSLYQKACINLGRDQVHQILEGVLCTTTTTTARTGRRGGGEKLPLAMNTTDALIWAAAKRKTTNKKRRKKKDTMVVISLDCIYFLLRRNPDVLLPTQ